ncbi:hypothetical protein Agabi119p4_6322 [Agaricus bisporus var. burnettii]|uniref:Uncharacterized protein n=1 Tax=Agaricus bisporus var. burnettii TaxID=192524 RepID=A0A8H7F024_AGABI|nr:hypothetical protein Agabi119p4_6322 [Agaricus bisporus var. burnettii]
MRMSSSSADVKSCEFIQPWSKCLQPASRYTRSPNFSVETTDQDLINPLYTGFRWIRPVLQRVREEAVGKSEISHPRIDSSLTFPGPTHDSVRQIAHGWSSSLNTCSRSGNVSIFTRILPYASVCIRRSFTGIPACQLSTVRDHASDKSERGSIIRLHIKITIPHAVDFKSTTSSYTTPNVNDVVLHLLRGSAVPCLFALWPYLLSRLSEESGTSSPTLFNPTCLSDMPCTLLHSMPKFIDRTPSSSPLYYTQYKEDALSTEIARLRAENDALRHNCCMWRKRAEVHSAATLGLLEMSKTAKDQIFQLAQERDQIRNEHRKLEHDYQQQKVILRSIMSNTSPQMCPQSPSASNTEPTASVSSSDPPSCPPSPPNTERSRKRRRTDMENDADCHHPPAKFARSTNSVTETL